MITHQDSPPSPSLISTELSPQVPPTQKRQLGVRAGRGAGGWAGESRSRPGGIRRAFCLRLAVRCGVGSSLAHPPGLHSPIGPRRRQVQGARAGGGELAARFVPCGAPLARPGRTSRTPGSRAAAHPGDPGPERVGAGRCPRGSRGGPPRPRAPWARRAKLETLRARLGTVCTGGRGGGLDAGTRSQGSPKGLPGRGRDPGVSGVL